MKSWKTWLGLGCGCFTMVACTITTGIDDSPDARVIDVVDDPDDDPPKTDEDSGPGPTKPAEDPDPDPEPDAATATPPVDSGMTDDPPDEPAFMCDVDAADECEACMARYCCDERKACEEDGTCVDEWGAMRACMEKKDLINNPSINEDGDKGEADECIAEIAPGGDILGFTSATDSIFDCVATDYDPMMASTDENSELLEGDDLCTKACYGVLSTNPL